MKFQLETMSFPIFTIFTVFRAPGIFKNFWHIIFAPKFVQLILVFFSASIKKIRSKFESHEILWPFEQKCPRFRQANGYWWQSGKSSLAL